MQTVSPVLNLTEADVVAAPFPHVVKSDIIRPSLFQGLVEQFPPDQWFTEASTWAGGRKSLYSYKRRFHRFLEQAPAWREFYDYIDSEPFVRFTLDLFAPHWQQFGLKLDTKMARFRRCPVENPFLTNPLGRRVQKSWKLLRGAPGNELHIELDISVANDGYTREVHTGNRDRVASLLVYLNGREEIQGEGGELVLFRSSDGTPYDQLERQPADASVTEVARIPPVSNTGVFFASAKNTYHSVSAVSGAQYPRKFIYLGITSSLPAAW